MAYAVAFSPDGQRLAFSSEKGSVKIWSTTTFQEVQSLPFESARPVFSVAFSPDGRHCATGHGDGFVRVWDVEERTLLEIAWALGTSHRLCRLQPQQRPTPGRCQLRPFGAGLDDAGLEQSTRSLPGTR
jgi:FOG: WD40 repeat